jgi:ribosomal protein S1
MYDQSNSSTPFTILAVQEKGFQIKIEGNFGYVGFAQMPWQYKEFSHWKTIGPYLIGKQFYRGIVTKDAHKVTHITTDGNVHEKKIKRLEIGAEVKGIILQKTLYGLFIDVGYGFEWLFGSMYGLAHQSNFLDTDTLDEFKVGDTISTLFLGYSTDNKMKFGELLQDFDLVVQSIRDCINANIEVRVKLRAEKFPLLLINDAFPATLAVTENVYGEKKNEIKEAIKNLKDGDLITCKLIAINYGRKKVYIKLLGT